MSRTTNHRGVNNGLDPGIDMEAIQTSDNLETLSKEIKIARTRLSSGEIDEENSFPSRGSGVKSLCSHCNDDN